MNKHQLSQEIIIAPAIPVSHSIAQNTEMTSVKYVSEFDLTNCDDAEEMNTNYYAVHVAHYPYRLI